MSGWVKIPRDEREQDPFADSKYSKHEAWIDLVMLANWEAKTWQTRKGRIEVARGSFVTSFDSLSSRWKWSKTTVRRFLKMAQECNRIRLESGTDMTQIFIVNYERYQQVNDTCVSNVAREWPAPDPKPGTQDVAEVAPTKEIIINNNKKNKQESNKPPNPLSGDPFGSDEPPIDIFPQQPKLVDEPKRELSPDLQAWVDYRKEIKKPIKTRSIEAIERKYFKRPDQLRAAVQHSISSGYQGLYDPPAHQFSSGPRGVYSASMHQNQRKSQNLLNQERTMQELKELLEECGHDVGTNGFPIS